MRKISAAFLGIALVACQDNSPEPDNSPNLRTLSQAEVQVAAGANDFAFNLFEKLQQPTPENTFISPLSVSMALGMLLNGAGNETQQSILNTIEFADFTQEEVNAGFRDLTSLLTSMDRTVELGIANSVWYDHNYPVHADFSATIQNYYDGKVQGADFGSPSTKEEINSWVEDKTNGKIKDLLESISPNEIMYLINTVYFKGEWTYQFDPTKTKTAAFTNYDNTSSSVNMMFSKGATVNYHSGDGVEVIEIPYGNEQFTFTVVMPGSPSEITTVANDLTAAKLQNWLSESDSVTVELELPRFKLEWREDIKSKLEAMGMIMHDYPKLFQNPLGVQVSRVIHQTFLEVNEKGSEAAAATAISIELTSAPAKPTRISINKPFLFMIREKHSGAILFLGQMVTAPATYP